MTLLIGSQINIEEIATALGGASRKRNGGFMAQCPCHDDSTASLSIDINDGKLLVQCFAGCCQGAVVAALKSRGLWHSGYFPGATGTPSIKRNHSVLPAKDEAIALWERASPATDGSRYLKEKGVKAHGLRYHKNALLVPVMDAAGNIQGVQRIWPDGAKRFTSGTNKSGHFFVIGSLETNIILIAEGYATAATLHEATGHTAVVAFDVDNLLSVAKAIREKYPDSRIVICADDDWMKIFNPGLRKAQDAAYAVGGLMTYPVFPENRADDDTDFNDLALVAGMDAVRHHIAKEIAGVWGMIAGVADHV